MCFILLAYQAHPRYPLIVAANRDEYHTRPTEAAHFWQGEKTVLAGRDLQSGGTWLGINRQGRLAMLTNYREPLQERPKVRSRGFLVSEFLLCDMTVDNYFAHCQQTAKQYSGFNLLFGTSWQLRYYSNRANPSQSYITAGVHGLSNHLLDTPWVKVLKGKQGLRTLVENGDTVEHEAVLALLSDRECAPDDQLPNTGIPLERERLFSALFIVDPIYGTRSSTVISVDQQGVIAFTERSFNPDGLVENTVQYHFSSV